jgi:hypothetical protein
MLTAPTTVSEIKKGILKSKSGCVGLFPMDLNSELKLRLQKSKHASVSNLKKSATTVDYSLHDMAKHQSSSESEDEHVDPGKNLAKLLRNVSKGDQLPGNVRDETNSKKTTLLKNLVNLDKTKTDDRKMLSTSEGESSGGGGCKEISSTIKNSAIARRRKFNEM